MGDEEIFEKKRQTSENIYHGYSSQLSYQRNLEEIS
jgi:hypothetical protein